MKILVILLSLTASIAVADSNHRTATAGDVLIESGTEDAVEVQSQHQGEIRIEINGENMTSSDDDTVFDDETLPTTESKDDFF